MLIDSHCHVFLEHFDEDLDDVITRAINTGVQSILLPNIDKDSIEDMLRVEEAYPNFCKSMIGLHPCSVDQDFESQLAVMESWFDKHEFVAVGEIGTDLYWDKTYWFQQKEAFKIQCEWAIERNLPVVIHCRESIDETIALVGPFAQQGLTGVFHCFTGDLQQATQIKEMGFYLGVGGVATFKNGGVKEVIQNIGLDQVMLETDSPYLAPTPHRGKRNEPSYVALVADKLSEVLSLDRAEVERITSQNAKELFRLS